MKKYYLGIDVSKGYADFIMLDANKKCVLENFQLDDTFEGHTHLYERLCSFFKEHQAATVYAGLESTGGYENNWFNALIKFQGTLNIQTARLNPVGVSAHGKAQMNRIVTDKISAQNIAEYMISHHEKILYQIHDPLASLRRQWCFVKMLTKQNSQLLNQLESLLYSANPELLVYCKDGVNEWLLKLLLKYPTAALLSKATLSSVKAIPYISESRARELVNNANKSVASAIDKVTEQLIISTVKQIIHLKSLIKSQTEMMAKECSVEEVNLLKSFPGISDYSAIGLILEIQTVERFSSAKKIASFFGLHPVYKESGDGRGGIRMSKQGSKEVRHILFMVALNSIRSNPLIKSIYLEHTERGMSKMAALGLCMHKIIRIIYGMLKNNTPFDPEVDKKNREKKSQTRKKASKDKNRRYQEYDRKAPVSRRENKKRKERSKSQSDSTTKDGIVNPVPLIP